MKRKPVKSSAILSVGYDAEKELLEIEFADTHHIYHYFDVSPELFKELIKAGSIGAYFNTYIKNHHEEYRVE